MIKLHKNILLFSTEPEKVIETTTNHKEGADEAIGEYQSYIT